MKTGVDVRGDEDLCGGLAYIIIMPNGYGVDFANQERLLDCPLSPLRKGMYASFNEKFSIRAPAL